MFWLSFLSLLELRAIFPWNCLFNLKQHHRDKVLLIILNSDFAYLADWWKKSENDRKRPNCRDAQRADGTRAKCGKKSELELSGKSNFQKRKF